MQEFGLEGRRLIAGKSLSEIAAMAIAAKGIVGQVCSMSGMLQDISRVPAWMILWSRIYCVRSNAGLRNKTRWLRPMAQLDAAWAVCARAH
jgi:hypothetical protein